MTTIERVIAIRDLASDIDGAIREKGGTTAGGLSNAPRAISELNTAKLQELVVPTNPVEGTIYLPEEGYDGFSQVKIGNVSPEYPFDEIQFRDYVEGTMTYCDLTDVTTIYSFQFVNKPEIRTYDLTKNNYVVTLSNQNAFTGCDKPTVLVPQSLYDSYVNAINWSSLIANNAILIQGVEV